VSAQTFPDFEIVATDDHSSDRTMAILGEYQKKDPRIRVSRNPKNLGLVGNWNRCVELAKGEWIKFVSRTTGSPLHASKNSFPLPGRMVR